MTVWVVLLTHWVAVDRVGVPLQAPAAVDVAVMFAQPEVQRAGESRDERDVGERPAYEVVAAVRGPVDQVVQVGHDEHAVQATLDRSVAIRQLPGANLGLHSSTLAQTTGLSLVAFDSGLARLPMDVSHREADLPSPPLGIEVRDALGNQP